MSIAEKPFVLEETELTQLADEIASEIVCTDKREWVDACDYPDRMGMNVAPSVVNRRVPFSATLWNSRDEMVESYDGTLCECAAFVLAQREKRGAR